MLASIQLNAQSALVGTSDYIRERSGSAKVAEFAAILFDSFSVLDTKVFSHASNFHHGISVVNDLADFSSGNWWKVAVQLNTIILVDLGSSVLLLASIGVKEAARFAATVGVATFVSGGIIFMELNDMYKVYQNIGVAGKARENVLQTAASAGEIFLQVIVLAGVTTNPHFVFAGALLSCGGSFAKGWLVKYDEAYNKLKPTL